jgi:hypothetical protein
MWHNHAKNTFVNVKKISKILKNREEIGKITFGKSEIVEC